MHNERIILKKIQSLMSCFIEFKKLRSQKRSDRSILIHFPSIYVTRSDQE